MTASSAETSSPSRLAALLGFLEHDPTNLQLIFDAASAALAEGELDQADGLIERYAAISPPTPALLNLKGLVALNDQRFADASTAFELLLAQGHDDPGLRFNLAWSKAMMRDYEAALALLDDAAAALPRGAALKIQLMHHLGLLEEALVAGAGLAEQRPHDAALMGALATVAIDAERLDLAELYARRAGGNPEGLATLGMLQLNGDRIDDALTFFDKALSANPDNARALLGKGLGLLAKGETRVAAGYIDQGAERFGHHLGSWAASGWAHFVNSEIVQSRASFEKALELDDSFAEAHGGLAVLDVVEGQMESAKRRTEVALRLDRNCFSAALAKTLILTGEGGLKSAERVRNIALNTPIGSGGRTIAQAMAGLGMAGWTPARRS